MAQAHTAMVNTCTNTAPTGIIHARTIITIMHARTTGTALVERARAAFRHTAANYIVLTSATIPTTTTGHATTVHVATTSMHYYSGPAVHNL